MLAQDGRRIAEGTTRTIDTDWAVYRVVTADHRMLDCADEWAGGGGAQRFAHAANERCGNRRALASRHPLRGASVSEFAFQRPNQNRAILDAARIRRESRIGSEVLAMQHARAEKLEMPVRPGTDRERPVARVKKLIGHDRRVFVAIASRFLARHERGLRDIDERCDGSAKE